MKELAKKVMRGLFTDYQINRIYFVDLPSSDAPVSGQLSDIETIRVIASRDAFAASPDARIRDHAWYLDEHAHAYGLYVGERLVCVCCFWLATHPKMPGKFPALRQDEAVMLDLLTAAECRGKGYALAIARYAAYDLGLKGHPRLWTWVWHSNAPSIRVFEKAGWSYSHLLLELQLRGVTKHLRLRLPAWQW